MVRAAGRIGQAGVGGAGSVGLLPDRGRQGDFFLCDIFDALPDSQCVFFNFMRVQSVFAYVLVTFPHQVS